MGQQLSTEEITDKCERELKLSRSLFRIEQRRKNGDKYSPPINLLVLAHEEWLTSLRYGRPLTRITVDFSPEEADLYLQHSCGLIPPRPWTILSLQIIPKVPSSSIRFPANLPQEKPQISTESVWDFFSHVAYYNQQLSWANFIQKDDCLKDLKVPPPQLTPKLFSHLVKKLYDMSVVALSTKSTAGSSGGGGFPHVKGGESPQATPANVCHPNLSPLLAAVESDTTFFLVYPQEKFTLEDLMLHTPAVLDGHETKLQFIVYQLLQCLGHLHQKGITMGEVGLGDVHIDNCLWIHLRTPRCGVVATAVDSTDERESQESELSTSVVEEEESISTIECLWGTVPSLPLGQAFLLWQKGELSNFDYLMILNYAAGRRMEDSNNHPIMPWVTDFSVAHGGWRDLTKTKHLLSKGERQLDFCYQGAKEENRLHPESAVVPHHIGDLLTDVTYYMYMARKTPKEVLCSRVRRNWVPGEYPTSMSHMYQWTPDECIPEFFCEPSVFASIHNDLPDLGIPPWVKSPEEFVRHHKAVLESDHVSANVHHWIDLTFGYKLTGESAVKAHNIHLALEDRHTNLTPYGVVQLFKSSHPPRLINSQCTPFALKHPDYEPFLSSPPQDRISSPRSSRDKASPPVDTSVKENTSTETSSAKSEEKVSDPAKGKLVFEDVNLKDMPSTKFVSFNTSLDDSFEDLSTIATSEAGRSVEDNDFGPASFSSIPGVIDQANQLMEQSITKNKRIQKTLVNVLRRERNTQAPEEEGYHWKNEQISSPFEFQPIDPLQKLTEVSAFWHKNFKTKPKSGMFAEMWTSEELRSFAGLDSSKKPSTTANHGSYFWERPTALSFEEEARKDIIAVTCVAAEMFLFKHLKTTLHQGMTLSERVNHLREYMEHTHGEVSYFVSSLIEYVFADLQNASNPSTLGLPGCSVQILLQQHVTVFAYPMYFDKVHDFLGGLHLLKNDLQRRLSRCEEAQVEKTNHISCTKVLEYISKSWSSLISTVDVQGLEILMLHLTAVFKLPSVNMEMVCCAFDKVTSFLSPSFVTSHFLHMVQMLYDTSTQPYIYGLILHRPFLNLLISRFGLKNFIRYFLVYVREAVLDPSSSRFPYLHQRPQSVVSTSTKLRSAHAPHAHEERESFSYSMTASERIHPSTPPPSPINEEFDVEEDDQEDNKEENPYEEYSLLLHPQTHGSSPEVKSSQEEESKSATTPGLSGLTPFELLTEEPLFLASQSFVEGTDFASKLATSLSVISSHQDPPVHDNPIGETNGGTLNAIETPSVVGEGTQQSPSAKDLVDIIPAMEDENGHVAPVLTEDSDVAEERKQEELAERVDSQMKEACSFLSRVALDSLQWLSQLLSPVLVTRHIVQPLLEALPRSFTTCIRGNIDSVPAVELLLFIAQLYGDDVIMKLYLPQVQKWMQPIENSQYTSKSESGLAAAISLLNVCMHAMDSSTVAHNIPIFASEYFLPMVHFTMSTGVVFALGCEARSFVCQAVLQLLLSACGIIGREKAFEISHLLTTVQIFFSRFDEVLSDLNVTPPPSSLAVANLSTAPMMPEYKKEVVEQLQQVLTPSFLQYAYIQFCHKIGQLKLKDWIHNIDTIENLVLVEGVEDKEKMFEDSIVVRLHNKPENKMEDISDDEDNDDGVDVKQLQSSCSYGPLQAYTEVSGLLGESASSETALWFVPLEGDHENGEDYVAEKMKQADAKFHSKYKSSVEQMVPTPVKPAPDTSPSAPSERKLIGSWSKLWESELETLEGMREQPLVFSNLRLQTYSGHRGPVTRFAVLPSESAFISASRDKTIKLWSLSNRDNRSDVTQCNLTYVNHQKTIVGMEYVAITHQVASCGTNLHIWDPDTGYCVHEYSPKTNQSFVSMVTLATPFPVVVMGTLDGHLQLFDLRMKEYANFWRLNADITSNATLRKLTSDENGGWVAGAFTGGTVHTVDPRNGEILKFWKAIDIPVFGQEITAMRSSKRGHILMTSSSGGVVMWSSRGELLQSRKDSSQVVQTFEVLNEQLIGVSSGNQLVFYNNIETQLVRPPRSVRVHSKTLKGTLLSCVPLKHNHTLLLGNDNGQIVLSV